MKKIINFIAIVSCFTLGASLAHADLQGQDGLQEGAMQYGSMRDGQIQGQSEDRIFKVMDTNGDGAITKAEFDAFHANRFKEMDSNGDGKILLEEMRSAHKKLLEQGKGKRFDEADANHDGALSREETEKMPRMSRRFDEMDANKDSKVTREEMEAAMKKWRRKNLSD